MSTGQKPSWFLHALHFALAVSLPFLLVLLVGCKKTEEEKPDYGPQVAGEAIDLALSKAIHGAHLDNVAVGQYLDHVVTRRLENEENTITMGGTRVEVIDKEETETTVKYTLRIFKSERLNGGTFETKVTEEPLVLEKNASLSSPLSAAGLAAEAVAATKAAGTKSKVTAITYHRLHEFTAPMQPPQAVRERPGCGGLSPCELQVRYIQFDMVQWHDDNTQIKVSLDFGFSVQPPFLPFGEAFDQFSGLLVVDCRSTYVPIESRTVYVRDCMTLEDFQK